MEIGNRERSDVAYLDTMHEVLEMVIEYAEKAQQSQDDVTMGAYLQNGDARTALRPRNLQRSLGAKPRRDGARRARWCKKYKVTLTLTADDYMGLIPHLGSSCPKIEKVVDRTGPEEIDPSALRRGRGQVVTRRKRRTKAQIEADNAQAAREAA